MLYLPILYGNKCDNLKTLFDTWKSECEYEISWETYISTIWKVFESGKMRAHENQISKEYEKWLPSKYVLFSDFIRN